MAKDDPKSTDQAAAVDHAPAIEALQNQVAELQEKLAAAEATADGLNDRVMDIEAAMSTLEDMLQAAGGVMPLKAEKKPVDAFDYEANPEGSYALVPGKIMGAKLDHPFEDWAFSEGKPQRANPQTDGWLRNQINAGFVVRWDEKVGEEHDQAIKAERAAREEQARIDALAANGG